MNELTVIKNRLKVIVEGMSDLAGPIKDSCVVLKDIVGILADSYRLKHVSDQENVNSIMQ